MVSVCPLPLRALDHLRMPAPTPTRRRTVARTNSSPFTTNFQRCASSKAVFPIFIAGLQASNLIKSRKHTEWRSGEEIAPQSNVKRGVFFCRLRPCRNPRINTCLVLSRDLLSYWQMVAGQSGMSGERACEKRETRGGGEIKTNARRCNKRRPPPRTFHHPAPLSPAARPPIQKSF